MEDCTPSKYSTGLLCRHAEESTEPGPFLFQSLEALAEAKRLKAEAPRPSPKQQVLTGFAFGLRCLFACQAEAAAGKKKKEASEQSSVLAVLAFVPIASSRTWGLRRILALPPSTLRRHCAESRSRARAMLRGQIGLFTMSAKLNLQDEPCVECPEAAAPRQFVRTLAAEAFPQRASARCFS